jgi:hypothetical protein
MTRIKSVRFFVAASPYQSGGVSAVPSRRFLGGFPELDEMGILGLHAFHTRNLTFHIGAVIPETTRSIDTNKHETEVHQWQ